MSEDHSYNLRPRPMQQVNQRLKRQFSDAEDFAPRKQHKENPLEVKGRKRRFQVLPENYADPPADENVKDKADDEENEVKPKHECIKRIRKTRSTVQLEISKIVSDIPSPEVYYASGCDEPTSIEMPIEATIDIEKFEERYRDAFSGQDIAEDVMKYLYELEKRRKISVSYLEREGDVTPLMRSMLIDWIIQVQNHLGLLQETLYLSVMLIDRFLMKRRIPVTKLQLVGITAIFIVSKLEERYPPQVKKLINLTEDCYLYNDMIRMERLILMVMGFDLIMAEPMLFLNRFMQITDKNATVENLSKYLMDIILPEKETAIILPSNLAAAALCLARHILQGNSAETWNKTLTLYSKYKEKELCPLMIRMLRALLEVNASQFQGARKKYDDLSKSQFVRKSYLKPVLHKISSISS